MRSLPGSRRQVKRSGVAVLSALLVAATALIFLHDVGARFDSLRKAGWYGSAWVGLGGAITLLFAAVSIHVARQQWGVDLYPLITYMRRRRTESEFALDVVPGSKLWCIEVSNLGGVAIVDHVRYDIELEGKPETHRVDVEYEEMLSVLESGTGAIDETDFVLVNWQGGFGIARDAVARLCEFPMPVVRQVKQLDAHVYYTSRFGGLYQHVVSVIPARGLPRERDSAG